MTARPPDVGQAAPHRTGAGSCSVGPSVPIMQLLLLSYQWASERVFPGPTVTWDGPTEISLDYSELCSETQLPNNFAPNRQTLLPTIKLCLQP